MQVNIRFSPSGRSVRVPPGTSVLEAIRRAGLPVASACDASGLCGRCAVRVLGEEPLPGEAPDEAAAKRRNRVEPGLRLACRLAATRDIEVTATYW